jgi:hypothetical protein
LVAFLNSLRDNTKAYVRVWRQEANYNVQGHNLPSPPPSVEQILTRLEPAAGAALLSYGSKVAEFELDAGGMMVTGSKTVQVEIKE